ncbi:MULTISPECIES: hypothetical protein [unclassified Ensifer]|uniref:hypothetical protein n=1 Tax=unclassified Ensifer TaxID=2633371 RepID=UPI0008136C4D|nr:MULTISPECIES: hypothetical protein [unclassified Ensifer]OCP19358.1 hypothetical protein BC361_30995 [Ensifer sp. LC54]OCP19517.1 hypothetical protein BC363_31135 [Ensifer sp. LC384]
MVSTRYERKIERIRNGDYRPGDFILADAKDPDLAGGILTTGRRRDAQRRIIGNRSRDEFLEEMVRLVEQDVIDILLASTSNIEVLQDRGMFKDSAIMPAFRANDTSDLWLNIRGGQYHKTPSVPYRGADLARAKADLCLYSMTFNNDAERDVATLNAYAAFRVDARAAGKKHFLEIFNPNTDTGFSAAEMGAFVNDCTVRALASLVKEERPEFLKVVYNGPGPLEELAGHDSSVVVGVMGGGGGTHRDTFEIIAQAERFGARLAIFGRKVNLAEHQPSLIVWMRAVADRNATPAEAVRGYRSDLERQGIQPDRSFEHDLAVTDAVLAAEAR